VARPDVTLLGVLVHVLAETARHAGHADILREQLDGRTGIRADNLNHEPHDDQWWADYRSQIESAAHSAASTWAAVRRSDHDVDASTFGFPAISGTTYAVTCSAN
jgi:hypothetical protein